MAACMVVVIGAGWRTLILERWKTLGSGVADDSGLVRDVADGACDQEVEQTVFI